MRTYVDPIKPLSLNQSAPEDDQFMHDEGWVEDFGGGGLDQIIKDLQAKLADPAISTKIRKKLTKELEAAQREQEYQK